MESHQAVFERDLHVYAGRELQLPELAILARFKERWAEMDVLDIGVGPGRTSHTFAALAKTYTGIDYAHRMIAHCKATIAESETVRFLLCDARDMSTLGDRTFDFVLFSFNGIDYVDHTARLRILREVHGRLRSEGFFFFSAHSLHAFPFRLTIPAFRPRSPIRWMYRAGEAFVRWARLRAIHRNVDAETIKARGWAILADGSHGFKATPYYVLPESQDRQLAEAGFRLMGTYDLAGRVIDHRVTTDDVWLHYLCVPEA